MKWKPIFHSALSARGMHQEPSDQREDAKQDPKGSSVFSFRNVQLQKPVRVQWGCWEHCVGLRSPAGAIVEHSLRKCWLMETFRKKACKEKSMKGGERIHHSAASLQREYRVQRRKRIKEFKRDRNSIQSNSINCAIVVKSSKTD